MLWGAESETETILPAANGTRSMVDSKRYKQISAKDQGFHN